MSQPHAEAGNRSEPRLGSGPGTASGTAEHHLARIAAALERLAPPEAPEDPETAADSFVWQAERRRLAPVRRANRIDLSLLRGIDRIRDILVENTRQFADGYPANNALLWGARGMGKSSLVKAVHGAIAAERGDRPPRLVLVEIQREEIASLPVLLERLGERPARHILFSDDLSFDAGDSGYKSLKAVLEGGAEARPANIILYATSNRRHLMPREMIENERVQGVNPGEAVEEKISLSDRFGLWLGFHACDQATYLAMVEAYATRYRLPILPEALLREANEWAVTRGGRSGRVAWQFIQDLAGRLRCHLSDGP